LNGTVVKEFEDSFCKYIDAPHGVSLSSESAAIFLLFKYIIPASTIRVPSMIPPVVPNHLVNAGKEIIWTDEVDWVGSHYTLYEDDEFLVIDSAQCVDEDQFKRLADPNKVTIMLFSFYPTKPIGGCDGGMLVSNKQYIVDHIRTASMNGMSKSANSWERLHVTAGWKMYLNSMQAQFALESAKKFSSKKARLKEIRDYYNKVFKEENTSHHLYTINVRDDKRFMSDMKAKGIVCGKHYTAAHLNEAFDFPFDGNIKAVEEKATTTVSLPFHEKLTSSNLRKIKKAVNKYR
jgi:dTDP-4-amino-4,6-dideoxygalactose transaminase